MTSTSTWHFSYAEHSKLTIDARIRLFPNFPVTSVEKSVLLHGLIIDRKMDHFCCFAPGPGNRVSRAGITERPFSNYLKKFLELMLLLNYVNTYLIRRLLVLICPYIFIMTNFVEHKDKFLPW